MPGTPRHALRLGALAALLPLVSAGAGPRPPRAPPALLTIVATDYAYRAPATARAGLSIVRLVNRGRRPHHVVITRLTDTMSLERFYAVATWGAAAAAPLADVDGRSVKTPGDSSELRVWLEPGRYAMYCFVPDGSDQRPHIRHGMIREPIVR